MNDFIKKLYANENFALYLGLIIILLIIVFFVVYFIGKIDQKRLEKTRKLDKIDPNAFKDLSSATNVQVAAPVMQQNQNVAPVQTIPQQAQVVVPVENVIQNTSVQPPVQAVQDYNQVQNYQQPVQQPDNYQNTIAPVNNEATYNNYTYPQVESSAIQSSINPVPEVQAPPVYENPIPVQMPVAPVVENSNVTMSNEIAVPENNQSYNIDFSNLTNSIEQELSSLENMTKQVVPNTQISNTEPNPAQQPVVPVVEQTSELEMPMPKNTKVVTDVFSSVYVPVKEETSAVSDEEEIELPKLKK